MENTDVAKTKGRQKTIKARYIKSIVFTSVNDIENIEEIVNGIINRIREAGGSIVSIVPHNYGISPMNMIYDVIYESERELTLK